MLNKLPPAIQLKKRFDVLKLRHDLDSVLGHVPFLLHSGPHHNGGWEILSLVSPGGKLGLSVYSPDHHSKDPRKRPKKTKILKKTPYFEQILDSMNTTVVSASISVVLPGGVIKAHRDVRRTFENGLVRLHIPIITDPKVEFALGGQRQRWRAGELWYGNFSLSHWIRNRSEVARVHLFMDVALNESICDLFPKSFLKQAAERTLRQIRC